MFKTVLLLGSGELGKEFTISMARLGQRVIAVDSYDNAPAMQVAQGKEVIDMLDGAALDSIVAKHRPDIIVPEIEAIRTERLYDYENDGIQVVPSARAANYTMNRKAIRELAAKQLGIRTANYRYATTYEELRAAVQAVGLPCVVKPLMSSSGKGQSTVSSDAEIDKAWDVAMAKGRGDHNEVIVEGFVKFELEITLLTVTQRNGPTLFCPPIGHRQERGDYQESWQPAPVPAAQLKEAQDMAGRITQALGGAGIWGVEFFLAEDGVVFSELSPRPHDTGMVTLAGTQTFSEFELHARAVLGLPIPKVEAVRTGASAVILSEFESPNPPEYSGLADALTVDGTDLRIFGKPSCRVHRRMGVGLAWAPLGESLESVRSRARSVADSVVLTPSR